MKKITILFTLLIISISLFITTFNFKSQGIVINNNAKVVYSPDMQKSITYKWVIDKHLKKLCINTQYNNCVTNMWTLAYSSKQNSFNSKIGVGGGYRWFKFDESSNVVTKKGWIKSTDNKHWMYNDYKFGFLTSEKKNIFNKNHELVTYSFDKYGYLINE